MNKKHKKQCGNVVENESNYFSCRTGNEAAAIDG